MQLLWDACREAMHLVVTRDALIVGAAWRSVWISTVAVVAAAVVGVPLGALLARKPFVGRDAVVLAFRAGMAMPTVFIGVVCFALFSRRGPLAPLDLLYSPQGVVLGEIALALPIVVSLTQGAVQTLDPRVGETALTLGAGPWQRGVTYLAETRIGVMLAVVTAFARCVTELGIAMIVGGNLRDRTRTLATATALETGRGEFARGLAMGAILLLIALVATGAMAQLSKERR